MSNSPAEHKGHKVLASYCLDHRRWSDKSTRPRFNSWKPRLLLKRDSSCLQRFLFRRKSRPRIQPEDFCLHHRTQDQTWYQKLLLNLDHEVFSFDLYTFSWSPENLCNPPYSAVLWFLLLFSFLSFWFPPWFEQFSSSGPLSLVERSQVSSSGQHCLSMHPRFRWFVFLTLLHHLYQSQKKFCNFSSPHKFAALSLWPSVTNCCHHSD